MKEWKPVVGYEGLYEVSNMGEVRSLRLGTRIADKENYLMRQKYDTKGYLRVNLHKNGKCKAMLVSRMVAEAFIPNPNGYLEVGHDDDCKENNCVGNLYWTTRQENLTHNNLQLRIRDKRNQGGLQRVVEALSVPVIGTSIENGKEIHFSSMQEAERNGFSCAKVSLCCSGQRNSHKGYRWRKAI